MALDPQDAKGTAPVTRLVFVVNCILVVVCFILTILLALSLPLPLPITVIQ